MTVLGDTSATEMDATNAPGYYLFDLTQAETNGNTILFSAKSSTANIVVLGSPPVVTTVDYSAQATAALDLTDGVESGKTPRQAMRAIASALCGNVTSNGGAYAALGNSGTPRLAVTNPTTTTRSVTSSL